MKRLAQALVPLLIIIIGFAVFFQGLPWQFRVREEYGSLRHNDLNTVSAMNADAVPEGWKEYSAGGIGFYAPAGLKYDEDEAIFTDDSISIRVYTKQNAPDQLPKTESVDEWLDELGLTAADMRWFCTRTQRRYPRDEYEFFELMGGLSAEDLDIHSYKQSRIFFALAEMCLPLFDKNVSYSTLEGEGLRAILISYRPVGDDLPYILARITPDGGGVASAVISTGSTATDLDIASSLHSAGGTTEET